MENRLMSMTDFVFNLRNKTTSELCLSFPNRFKRPVWNGSQSDMVKDMLAIDAIQWKMVGDYAKFIIQLLEIWMFIPCKLVDGVWVVLEEPYNDGMNDQYYLSALEEYQQAKERCLFDGFEVVKENFIHNTKHHYIELNKTKIMWNFNDKWELYNEFKTIENLVKYNPTLTQTAQKQLSI